MPGTTARSILEAARRVVEASGSRGFTLTAVAAEAGVSRPTLYRWFPSKPILLAALAADAVDRFDRGLHDVLAGSAAPRERLHAALRYIVRYLDDTAAGSRAIQTETSFAVQSLADTITSHVQLLVDLLGDALDCIPAVADGHVSPHEATEILLRVAYSHYLVPHPDPDELLRALCGIAGIAPVPAPRRPRARTSGG